MDLDNYTTEYLKHYKDRSFELYLIAARRRQVLKSVERYPHDRILEVGCGVEPLFLHIDNFKMYTVVEPSAEFAERARQQAAERDSITVLQEHLEDAASKLLQGEAFDFIILSSLLHEVPDPHGLLSAVHLLCGPSTTLHINVSNVYSFHRLLALEMGLVQTISQPSEMEIRFQRHTRFDRQSFTKIVEEHDFRVLAFGTYLIKPFTNDQIDAMLKRGIIDGAVIEGLEGMTKYLPEMGCEMFIEARRV